MAIDDMSESGPTQLPSGMEILILTVPFARISSQILFAHWTEPELLTRWWPPAAELEAHTGGLYHFSWPANDWHLRGELTRFDSPNRMSFTWSWDHDPDAPVTEVAIAIAEIQSGGSRLHLTHGVYESSEAGREMRQGHLEGWMYFLSRLQALHV